MVVGPNHAAHGDETRHAAGQWASSVLVHKYYYSTCSNDFVAIIIAMYVTVKLPVLLHWTGDTCGHAGSGGHTRHGGHKSPVHFYSLHLTQNIT